MKMVIVDTDVLSYIFKGDTRGDLYQPHLLNVAHVISFMTVAELEHWALARQWGVQRRRQMKMHLQQYTVIQSSLALCRLWAEVFWEVVSTGQKISVPDAWIAATALLYQAPLVTHNRKDYAPVSGLSIISEAP